MAAPDLLSLCDTAETMRITVGDQIQLKISLIKSVAVQSDARLTELLLGKSYNAQRSVLDKLRFD
jgi:hypothetical protein